MESSLNIVVKVRQVRLFLPKRLDDLDSTDTLLSLIVKAPKSLLSMTIGIMNLIAQVVGQ